MNLVLVGLNHRTASVQVRQCLAAPEDSLPQTLSQALALAGVREAMMVSTCNRVELLAAADNAKDAAAAIGCWLAQGREVGEKVVRQALYTHSGDAAVRHLFRVAASLDSLVLGEPQILGQIKEAYRTAAAAGATRTVLNKLLHKTFQVAKRVRSETNIGGAAVSISFAAVELAKKIFDELDGLSVALVGAGEMAELAAEHLVGAGVGRLLVVNRTLERAVALHKRLGPGGGGAYSLDDLPTVLPQVDIVITSTGATEAVITRSMARQALRKRRGRPVFFIDIAVPRDVAPQVAQVDGCFVYDIDDLTEVVEHNRAARQDEAARAEQIVAEEVVKFHLWLRSLEVVPTIAELTGKAEKLRAAEVARTLHGMGPMDESQAQALELLTKALVKKMLHDPIMFLKDQAHDKSTQTQRDQLALVRRLFALGEDAQDPKS